MTMDEQRHFKKLDAFTTYGMCEYCNCDRVLVKRPLTSVLECIVCGCESVYPITDPKAATGTTGPMESIETGQDTGGIELTDVWKGHTFKQPRERQD